MVFSIFAEFCQMSKTQKKVIYSIRSVTKALAVQLPKHTGNAMRSTEVITMDYYSLVVNILHIKERL
ncbi:hypothetical protein B5F93_16355 [Odoribacter splanchnicus]|nr:hypothetical protein B5F93_16355 [Odoribacter splanchnicus]